MSGRQESLVDLSHTVQDGMITYEGLPGPVICDFLSREESRSYYAEGTEFHIGKIEMVANTGTYLDAPFHRYAEGKDLSELPLSSLANLDAERIRIDPGRDRAIDSRFFRGLDLTGKAILVETGWSSKWLSAEYFRGHPFLTGDAAELLRDSGAALVGIDSYNIDDTDDGSRPVHTILLGAEIPIVEHMTNLHRLPGRSFRFSAVPVKVSGLGTFPVRAFAAVKDP